MLRYVLQSGLLGIGAYLVVVDRASGGVMIASSIMMGRALAPVEIALGSWRQLVAARQGIARLREICKATARLPAPPVALPRPCRELSVSELFVSRARELEGDRLERFIFAQGRHGSGAAGRQRLGQDITIQGAGGNLAGPARRGPARRRRARPMGRASRPIYRLICRRTSALLDGTVAENICRFDQAPALTPS